MASFCLELETEAVKTCLHSSTEGKEIMMQKVRKPWPELMVFLEQVDRSIIILA